MPSRLTNPQVTNSLANESREKVFLAQRLVDVQQCLEAALVQAISESCAHPTLREAMVYAAVGSAKRLRSLLIFEVGALLGAKQDAVLPLAVAIELVHAYSLVHDDLPSMDDADERRGQPSCHKRFDEATAILAGDALLTLAFEVIASPQVHPRGETRAALVCDLARAIGPMGMVGGQMLDLYFTDSSLPMPQRLQDLHDLKTGALIAVACGCAARLAGASEGVILAMQTFGVAVGRAYQMRDDILDQESDLRTGAATAALCMSPQDMQHKANVALHQAREILTEVGAPADSHLWDFLDTLAMREV